MALEAKSEAEALDAIKTKHPRDWFNNGMRIRDNVSREFKLPTPQFKARPLSSFKVPDIVREWFNTNVAASGLHDRYPLLVVEGPTKLGKTQMMRALHPEHLYWKGMCKMDELRNPYKYLILDDIEWKFVPGDIKKSVLLGTGDAIVTDRYVKKLRVYCNAPAVFITNPLGMWDRFYEQDSYWVENTQVVKINNKLY